MNADNKIYTVEEVTEMCDTWANFNGFTGEVCSKCKRTANVFALGAGWQKSKKYAKMFPDEIQKE